VLEILEQYCRNADTATFEEINEFEATFDPNGKTHSACLIAGYNTMVRVNDDLFVSDKHVTFDVKSIDEAISVYCRGDFVPLRRVIDFSLFPFVGYPWNLYLLESYVRRFSNDFKYDVRAVNSSSIGVIVRKDFAYNGYDEILSIALANSLTDLNDTIAVGNYLFNNGYIGWRNLGKSENTIAKRAKTMRDSGHYISNVIDEEVTSRNIREEKDFHKIAKRKGMAELERLGNEWIEKGYISRIKIFGRHIAFRTKALDELFPIFQEEVEGWTCSYIIENIPLPNIIHIQFVKYRFDSKTMEKFNMIKPYFNNRMVKEDWEYHRLISWKLDKYNPDKTNDFYDVKDSLIVELEHMITETIPKFERTVGAILEENI
jgi:hypothetical protein